ncbi:unnamed protein product, partial [Phaeothamnion confervicola]
PGICQDSRQRPLQPMQAIDPEVHANALVRGVAPQPSRPESGLFGVQRVPAAANAGVFDGGGGSSSGGGNGSDGSAGSSSSNDGGTGVPISFSTSKGRRLHVSAEGLARIEHTSQEPASIGEGTDGGAGDGRGVKRTSSAASIFGGASAMLAPARLILPARMLPASGALLPGLGGCGSGSGSSGSGTSGWGGSSGSGGGGGAISFSTGNGRPIHVSEESLARAERMFRESVDRADGAAAAVAPAPTAAPASASHCETAFAQRGSGSGSAAASAVAALAGAAAAPTTNVPPPPRAGAAGQMTETSGDTGGGGRDSGGSCADSSAVSFSTGKGRRLHVSAESLARIEHMFQEPTAGAEVAAAAAAAVPARPASGAGSGEGATNGGGSGASSGGVFASVTPLPPPPLLPPQQHQRASRSFSAPLPSGQNGGGGSKGGRAAGRPETLLARALSTAAVATGEVGAPAFHPPGAAASFGKSSGGSAGGITFRTAGKNNAVTASAASLASAQRWLEIATSLSCQSTLVTLAPAASSSVSNSRQSTGGSSNGGGSSRSGAAWPEVATPRAAVGGGQMNSDFVDRRASGAGGDEAGGRQEIATGSSCLRAWGAGAGSRHDSGCGGGAEAPRQFQLLPLPGGVSGAACSTPLRPYPASVGGPQPIWDQTPGAADGGDGAGLVQQPPAAAGPVKLAQPATAPLPPPPPLPPPAAATAHSSSSLDASVARAAAEAAQGVAAAAIARNAQTPDAPRWQQQQRWSYGGQTPASASNRRNSTASSSSVARLNPYASRHSNPYALSPAPPAKRAAAPYAAVPAAAAAAAAAVLTTNRSQQCAAAMPIGDSSQMRDAPPTGNSGNSHGGGGSGSSSGSACFGDGGGCRRGVSSTPKVANPYATPRNLYGMPASQAQTPPQPLWMLGVPPAA